jgi:high-affinity iron transporter
MLGALIIVFREVIEAGLIVGIILAVTRGLRGSRWLVGLGVAAGAAGASIVAAFAGALAGALAGIGQEAFNAAILLLAVAMLTWHNVWMASHGRELAAEVKGVGAEVRAGTRSALALAVVVAVAVMREGSEVALFLYGLAASAGASRLDLLEGGALGLMLGAGVTALTYFGLVTIPTRWLFRVTTVLITFLAAGLAAQAMMFLQQAGLVEALGETAWNSSAYLSDTSLLGRVAHTLIGYDDQPSQLQVLVYAVVLFGGFGLSKLFAPQPAAAAQVAAAE